MFFPAFVSNKLHDVITDEPVAHGLHAVDGLNGRCLCSIVRGLIITRAKILARVMPIFIIFAVESSSSRSMRRPFIYSELIQRKIALETTKFYDEENNCLSID